MFLFKEKFVKKSNFAILGFLVAIALILTACKTGSSSDSSYTPSNSTATKPTLSMVTGTWVRTITDNVDDETTGKVIGTKTKKSTISFTATGAFTQIEFAKKTYTDGTADFIYSKGWKGTASIADTKVTFTYSGYYEKLSELTSTDGISWLPDAGSTKETAVIIDDKLYFGDGAFTRTAPGLGLIGTWSSDYVETNEEVMETYVFTDSTWSLSSKYRNLPDTTTWDR